MRLEAFTISRARHLADVTLQFPTQGLTIIVGPNETGKSTVVACLRALLRERFTSERADVRALSTPSGELDLSATMRLEDGRRLTLSKRWFRGRRAQLDVDGASSTSGQAAEVRFAELLESDGLVGGTDDELLEAFLADQRLTPAPKRVRQRVSRALDEALTRSSGAAVLVASDLLERARRELQRYETPQRRAPTPLVREASRVALELEQRVAAMTHEAKEIHDKQVLLSTVMDELAQLPARLSELEAQLRERSAQLEALEEVPRERTRVELELERREDTATRLRAELDDVRSLTIRIDSLRADLAVAVAKRHELDEQQRASAQQLEHLRTLAADLVQRRLALERERELARTASLRAAAFERRKELARRLEEHAPLRRELAALAQSQPPTVDPSLLDQLERLDTEIRVRRRVAEDDAPRLSVTPRRLTAVQLDGVEVNLDPRETLTLAVTAPRTIEVGEVSITFEPGRIAADLVSLSAERDRLLGALRVTSLEEARERRRRLQASQQGQKELRDELRRLAPEGEDALRAELADAEELSAQLAAAPTRPLAEIEAALEDLNRDEEDLRREIQRQATYDEDLHRSSSTVRDAVARLETELEHVTAQRDRSQPPEDLERLIAGLAAEQTMLRQKHEALVKEDERRQTLSEDRESILRELEGLRAYRERLNLERSELASAIGVARGLADRLALEAERLAEAKDASRRIQQQWDAARYLVEVLERVDQDARARWSEPYRASVERLLSQVLAEEVHVTLDDTLALSSIRRGSWGSTPRHLNELSAGTIEQVQLVERIAASQLTRVVPVILDDVLGYSDATRARRMVSQLRVLGDDLQIIVLTAHRERYLSAPDAHIIDLDELTRAAHLAATRQPPASAPVQRHRREAAQHETLRDRVLDLLGRATSPMSRSEIAVALGADPAALGTILHELRSSGAITMLGKRRGARYARA